MRMKVGIVLVNWNGMRETIDCLESLVRLELEGLEVLTVVVDNASMDDSIKQIRKKYPMVTILEEKKNVGFSGGNNRGIRYVIDKGVDYVWLLNNDTTSDEKALGALVKGCNETNSGIVGSKIYFSKGREFHNNRYKPSELGKVIWYAGGEIDWANMYGRHRGVDEVDVGQYDERGETEFVSGCSMLVQREVIERIGMLDEKFFVYWEDVDFCLRAKNYGYKICYEPKSVIWHKNASSSGGSGSKLHEYYQTRNRLLIGMRFARVRTKLALLREAMLMLTGEDEVKKQAVIDFFLGRFGKKYE